MKFNSLKTLLIGSSLVLSSFANAAIISGNHQTDDGKNVELSGLDWLTWDQTNNLSVNDIINGVGNSFIADGWRYASRGEFEDLFDSLSGRYRREVPCV